MRKKNITAAVLSLLIAAGTTSGNIYGPVICGAETTDVKETNVTVTETEEKVYSKSCGENAMWTYDTESKTLTVSGTGKIVTSTSLAAEKWFDEVKHLIVEDGIESVYGFYGCRTLETVSLPDSVKNIDGAFEYCTALKSITIPEGVVGISFGSLMGCSSLEEVHFGSKFSWIGWGALSECTSLKHIDLPETLTSIDTDGFSTSGLESIKLPDGIKEIEGGTFSKCTDLAEVILPSELEKIEREAFIGTAIEKIDIPESTDMIGDGAFACCRFLKEVTVRCDKCSISESAFVECDSSLVIKAHRGSTAEEYAEKNGYAFEALEDENTETTVGVVPKTEPAGGYDHGDLNLDGSIDLTDLSELMLMLVDRKIPDDAHFMYADVDYNGEVDLADCATLRMFLSKKIESLPVPKAVSYASYEERCEERRKQSEQVSLPPTPSNVPYTGGTDSPSGK